MDIPFVNLNLCHLQNQISFCHEGKMKTSLSLTLLCHNVVVFVIKCHD